MKLADFGLAIEVAKGEKGWYGKLVYLCECLVICLSVCLSCHCMTEYIMVHILLIPVSALAELEQ